MHTQRWILSREDKQRELILRGRWVKTLQGYRTFHPNELPPPIEWTADLALALGDSSTLVGKLAGEGRRLPNPHIQRQAPNQLPAAQQGILGSKSALLP